MLELVAMWWYRPMPSDKREDKMNELAWILLIIVKHQLESRNSDKYAENYLKCECLLTGNRVNIFRYVWGHSQILL